MKKQLEPILKMAIVPLILAISTLTLFANEAEVNDLINTILQVSPAERTKLASYNKSVAKKPKISSKQLEPKSKAQSLVPDMGIPESQLLDAAAKFPEDIQGKYIYGTVTFKALRNYEGEPHIQFSSKNRRIFILYTRDPAVLNAFSQMTWGTKFTIPKECPLRLLSRDLLPGSYVVRLPYDMSNKDYTIGEKNREFGDTMKKDFQDLGNSFKELGEIFNNPSTQ
jgi:hypothetical protein